MTPGRCLIIVTARMSRSGRAFHARLIFPTAGVALAWLVASAIALAVPIGCDAPDEEDGGATAQAAQSTRQFNVDEKLIAGAQRFESFGVEFSPPAGWTALPADQVAAVAAAVNGGAGEAGAGNRGPATRAMATLAPRRRPTAEAARGRRGRPVPANVGTDRVSCSYARHPDRSRDS